MKLFTKRWLAKLVVFCMMVSLMLGSAQGTLSAYASTGGFSDVQDHWAAAQINDWVAQGIIRGYADKTFRPDGSITRAEFVALVNRTFGYTEKSAGNFPDVKPADWFADDVSKAKAAGYIQSTDYGKFLPNNKITRQEVAVILYKILELKAGSSGAASAFKDSGSFPKWSKDYINAVTAAGYMSGYTDKTFRAGNNITRAEAVAVLSRAAGKLFSSAGSYGVSDKTQEISGNATITADGVSLSNAVIDGNLYLTEGIGSGEVTLDNVTVKGIVMARGGGANSIKIKNSKLGQIVVEKKDGIIRIVSMGDTTIDKVDLKSGAKLEEQDLTGEGFKDVILDVDIPASATVQLIGDFDYCTIDSPATVQIQSGTVNNLIVAESASATHVTGNGKIGTADINAKNVIIDITPDTVKVKNGLSAVVGGETVEGSDTTKDETVSGGGSGGGGSDGGGSDGGGNQPGQMAMDGDSSDWADVTPLNEDGTGNVSSISAFISNGTLYALVRGDNIGNVETGYFEMDTDMSSSTGYKSANWSDCGIDYMLEKDLNSDGDIALNLYSHPANDNSWNWTFIATAGVAGSPADYGAGSDSQGDFIEISVDLNAATNGAYNGGNIGIAYMVDDSNLIPARGGGLVEVAGPSAPPEAAFGESLTDWTGVATLGSGMGYVKNLYAKQGDKLYIRAEGTSHLSKTPTFFIDTDSSPVTGYQSEHWLNTGADYKVQGDELYRYSGDGNSDDWTKSAQLSEASVSKGATASEVAIDYSALGLTGPSNIKVGFYLQGGTQAPATGNPMARLTVPNPPDVRITIDGSVSDWAGLNAQQVATYTASLPSNQLYAAEDNTYLYLLAKGPGLTSEHYFYLDTDMDNTTGFSSAVWNQSNLGTGDTRTGIDYFIASGDIEHQTSRGGWGFAPTGKAPEIAVNSDNTVVEERIKLSDIGLTGPATVRIGYRGADDNHVIPELGSSLTTVLTAPTGTVSDLSIAADGDSSDWAGIDPLHSTVPASTTYNMYAIQDDQYLYVYANTSGANFDQGQTYLFIDTDPDNNDSITGNNNTGCISGNWAGSGADYLVDNSNLYKQNDPVGRSWNWDTANGKPVDMVKTASTVEMRIKLSDLGLSEPSKLKLGYWGNGGAILLPANTAPMGTLASSYQLPKGVTAQFAKIPNAIGLVSDDLGWQGGTALWNTGNDPTVGHPDGPARLVLDRDPTLDDYKTFVSIGEAVNSRLMGAFVLSELDKNKVLADPKYNPTATPGDPTNFNITEYGTSWTNSDYAGTTEKDAKLDELMQYVYDNASYMEFGMHGVRHDRFANDEPLVDADGNLTGETGVRQSDAEWGPITNDSTTYISHVPYTQRELTLKAQAFLDILRQYFTPEQSSFPKSMVPPRHGWVYTSETDPSTETTPGDPSTGSKYTFTSGQVLSQNTSENPFGVKYVNGDATIDTDLGDGGFDNGLLFMNRQYGAPFNAIGETPNTMPMEYGKLGWVESHFPNLWGAKDKWVTYLNEINDHPYRYLPRNTEQLSSQWLYMKYATVTGASDGVTFTIDTTGMPQQAYDDNLLGTLVLKTPLKGKHISSAEITGTGNPQITGYYEDKFGYGYIEIADGSNTMGRLDKGTYTLTCTIGDSYMNSYVDFTKGTYNVYSFNPQSDSATVKLEMYGTQDVKIKLPFAPTDDPASDNANLTVNSWDYKDGFLTMNVTGVNIQGEVGTITVSGVPLAPQSWYVDGKNGNDGNDGTSLATAWKTINAAAQSTHVHPGDTVYVKGYSDYKYNETVTFTRRGIAGNAVTFTAYDSTKPVIDGTGLTISGEQGLININGLSYITIDGFELENLQTDVNDQCPDGIYIHGSGSNITVQNCVIHDIKHTATSDGMNAHGIVVVGDTAAPLTGVYISNNTLYNMATGYSETLTINGNVTDFHVLGNTIHDVNNIGIVAAGYYGRAPSDVDYARNGEISGNTLYNVSGVLASLPNPAYNGTPGAPAIYADGCDSVIISGNKVYDSDRGIGVLSENDGQSATNCIVRNNVIYNNYGAGIYLGGYEGQNGGTSGCYFVNNTLFQNSSGSSEGEIRMKLNCVNNVIKNNIIYARSDRNIFIDCQDAASSSGNSIDFNMYYQDGGTYYWYWGGSPCTDSGSWKTASGADAHSIFGTNPQFTTTGSAIDLSLAWSSPAKNNGANLAQSGTVDVAGNPRTFDVYTDIGAYELQSNGYFKLVNVNSGLVMATTGGSIVVQTAWSGASSQKWYTKDAGDGYYWIQNVSSELDLDVPDGSSTAGTALDLRAWEGTANDHNKHWLLHEISAGIYQLINETTGMAVDVPGSSTADGVALDQWTPGNTPNQYWLLVPNFDY